MTKLDRISNAICEAIYQRKLASPVDFKVETLERPLNLGIHTISEVATFRWPIMHRDYRFIFFPPFFDELTEIEVSKFVDGIIETQETLAKD